MKPMTNEEKHLQILKEVKATFVLIIIVAAWHIGFAFLLEDIDMMICGMPLWFFVSTIGAFVISVIGVIFLLAKVFKNFDLGEEFEDDTPGAPGGAAGTGAAGTAALEGGDLND